MLAYALALAVGLGSFALYLAAFFLPEVHRKHDFIWSGVGLFYALVLWVCAGRITGGLLLGQIASVALLGWFGSQTLDLRREQTPIAQQTQLPGSATSLGDVLRNTIHHVTQQLQTRFQDGSWKSTLPRSLDQPLKQVTGSFAALKDWIQAFLSTTFRAPQTPPNETGQNKPGQTAVPVDPQATSSSAQATELEAEWDDLESEAHPELDTVDGVVHGVSLSDSHDRMERFRGKRTAPGQDFGKSQNGGAEVAKEATDFIQPTQAQNPPKMDADPDADASV